MTTLAGSVQKRTYQRDGRTWTRFIAYLEVGQSGQRKQRTKSFAKEREAKAWLAQQQALAESTGFIGAKAPTLAAHLDAWLKAGTTRKRKPWSPGAAQDYESIVRKHLKPRLGHLRLDELTVFHVESLLGDIANNRAVNVRIALSSALTMAVKQRLVPYNVARNAELPEIERKPIEPLSPDEALQFVEAVKGHRLANLYTVTMALALRQGEAVGLRWSDVDLDAGELHVRQQISRHGGEYIVREPKSASSKRTLQLPAPIVELLREHRRSVLKEQLAASEWEDRDLVFPSSTGGPLYGPYVTRTMARLMERAGLPRKRFHDLRHTGASVLLSLGVDLRTIQAVLGHSSFEFTANTYVHPDKELRRAAAHRMGEFLVNRP